METQNHPHQAALLMLGACLSFSAVVAISKILGDTYDTAQQVFFRNLFGVAFVVISLIQRPAVHRGGRPLLLLSRGLVGTLALYLLFYSITTLGLARAVTYQYTYPLFMALFSFFLFKEKPAKREIAAIFVGMLGVWLIFKPDMNMPFVNHILGLSNAILTTFAYLAIKQLSRFYDSRYIVLSFMLSGIILPLISFAAGQYFDWENMSFLLGHFIWPKDPIDLLLFAALGITALIGQVLMTNAFAKGNVTQVAPIGYSSIFFSTLIGLWLGESFPDQTVIAGMVLIISGGILITAFPKA